MNTFYELIHLPSGNVVGDFDTQPAALAALRRIIRGEPTSPITDFALMRGDGDDQELVAMRAELRDLVDSTIGPAIAVRQFGRSVRSS